MDEKLKDMFHQIYEGERRPHWLSTFAKKADCKTFKLPGFG
jgi:hypothetical protein